jgi:AraC-like DNA-binding protein
MTTTTMAVWEGSERWAQHRMPGAHALQLVRLVVRWQVSPSELLEGFDVSEAGLAQPGATLPLRTAVALFDRARTLTQEPGLGFYLGLSKRPSGYGYAGFACMSAESFGQAVDLAIRFAPVLTTAISLRLERHGGLASLVVDEHTDAGSVRDMLLTSALVGLRQVSTDITAGRLKASIDLLIPRPAYYERFASLVPMVRFGQSANRLVFDASALALPLTMSDPAAVCLAGEQCERVLEDRGPEGTLLSCVRRALVGREGFRSLRHVATDLHMSSRTLTRRLADQRTSFSDLVDHERHKKALRLLSTSRLSLDDVSVQLGYSAISNFARAFHRWTGQTPAAYRRQHVQLDRPAYEAANSGRAQHR